MTIVVLLSLAWIASNVGLVLALRRSARIREREPRRAGDAALSG